jgi:hypothetical protein
LYVCASGFCALYFHDLILSDKYFGGIGPALLKQVPDISPRLTA